MPEHETDIDETAATEQAAAIHDAPGRATAAAPAAASAAADPETLVAYDSATEDPGDWEEPIEELPRRPRRRLLGKGGNPLALSLLGVLLIACGFIGGVLIEKGETSSSSPAASGAGGASGLASRFAALRGGASGAGSSTTGGAAAQSSGGSTGAGAGFTRPTSGTVAYLAGSTLYVTNSEGNTVKVKTSAGTTVNKTVKSTVKDIHPGETVTVTGATGSNGAVTAELISAGSSGGGLSALFGGGAGSSGAASSGAAGSSSSGTPALFGGGG
jgi:hypothetical protein